MTEIGWEGQCDNCRQWWPLDLDNWKPKAGLRQCVVCVREDRAAYLRRLRDENPELRARHRVASRANFVAKRAADPQRYLEAQRSWYVKNHVRLNAERAEMHLIKLEMAGKTPSRKPVRDETPETLAYRAAFRRKWIEQHGEIVVEHKRIADLERRRAYNREWMRRKRMAA